MKSGRVIAVVLLVTDAKPAIELENNIKKLSAKYRVPFLLLWTERLDARFIERVPKV